MSGASPGRAHHGPLRLSAPRRRFAWIAGWALWGTGLGWLLFHYFIKRQGLFGPQAHPLEIWWLRLHAALGLLALWGFGMAWSAHIVAGWHAHRRRWSGGTVFALLSTLVATGYFIDYLIDDTWHERIALVHWIVGLVLPAPLVIHVVRGRRRRRVA